MDRHEDLELGRKPVVQRQPGRAKLIVQKNHRRAGATAKEFYVSSAHFDDFFLTITHCQLRLGCCSPN
jgi:hypothetical protein